MARYIGKRLLWMIPVIIGVAILIFSLMYYVPGNPAKIILGSEATEQQLAEKTAQMGLDQPYLVQLGNYLYNVFLKFDFGNSYITNASVAGELMTRMPRTAIISVVSILITALVGIPLGISAATHAGKWQDSASMLVALAGVSMPDFWVGMMPVSYTHLLKFFGFSAPYHARAFLLCRLFLWLLLYTLISWKHMSCILQNVHFFNYSKKFLSILLYFLFPCLLYTSRCV